MRIIVVASRKGGSGKTTLAGHLGVQAEREGIGKVALADMDPQGSLTDWWNLRRAPGPHFLQTTVQGLADDVAELRRLGFGLLIIDTPPALTTAIREVVSLCDLVLLPTRPSPHDLRAIGKTVRLVEDLGKPLVFVLNGATPRARITGDALALLSQYGPLAPVIIHQRVDFASSMIDGRTVMELSGPSRSADEVAALWLYLAGRLVGAAPRRVLPRLPGLVVAGEELPAVSAEGA